MKKIIILIALFALAASVNAQVDGTITSEDVQTKYNPKGPAGIVRLEIDTYKDSVKVYYWIYKYIGNIRLWKLRKHDCFIPWAASHKYSYTYQLFNAWIRETYNIE